MGVFRNTEELYEILGAFFNGIKMDADIGGKIAASKLVISFEYSDPDSVITVDASQPDSDGGYFRVLMGPTDVKPEVVMSMKGDVAHQFWLGKVNLLAALSRRQIVAKGPIPKTLKLLPAIQPAYERYAEFLRERGRQDLVG